MLSWFRVMVVIVLAGETTELAAAAVASVWQAELPASTCCRRQGCCIHHPEMGAATATDAAEACICGPLPQPARCECFYYWVMSGTVQKVNHQHAFVMGRLVRLSR